jgi:nitrogen fixation NifU-like protein
LEIGFFVCFVGMNLYSDLLLDHAKHPRNVGKFLGTTATATVANVSCGDAITVYIKGGKIKYEIRGCAVATASASILSEMKLTALKKMTEKDLTKVLGFELTPARVKCAALPLAAIKKAVKRA